MRRLTVVAVLGLGSSGAYAQVVAGSPPPPEQTPAGFGARIAIGHAYAGGMDDAWAFQFQEEVLPVIYPWREGGPFTGIALGVDYWRAKPGTWGMDLPVLFQLGVRGFGLRAQAGLGFEALVVDRLAFSTGAGLWAPLAQACAGLDLFGAQLLVDARVARRWQWGNDDFTQFTVTVSLGGTWEAKPPVY